MLHISSVYLVYQPLHVSGIFVVYHQEVYCIYTAIGTCCAFQLTDYWPSCGGIPSKQHVPAVVCIQYTS